MNTAPDDTAPDDTAPDDTAPDDTAPDDTAPPPLPPPARVRSLRRASESPLGGVATGIASYFDVSPLIVQVAFVASVALGGFGALAYIACWFLIPRSSDPETRPVTMTSDTTRAIFGVLFAVGAVSATLTLGPGTFEITVVPLLLIAAGFYLLNQREAGARPAVPHAQQPGISHDHGDSQGYGATQYGAPQHWAAVDPEPSIPFEPEPPSPPVTSVTLAVGAVAVGLLLTINQFGPSIPAAAVIGSALAIVGGGLIYGAFRGRARGLVPLGLLLAISLALAPAFDAFADGGTGSREYSPVNEADVLDVYDLGAGPLELDLRRVNFTEDRTIKVNVGAGYAEIWLPNDVNVDVDASTAAGYIELFGRENAGVLIDSADTRAPQTAQGDEPTITIEAEITFGYVEVRRG